MSCDFVVEVRLVAPDGSTVLANLSDEAAGYEVVEASPVDEIRDVGTIESPFVNGDFEAWSKDGAGRYGVVVRVNGATWAQVETRRLALRTAYRSAPSYFLDVVFEGVTTRYRCRRPDVSSPVGTVNLAAGFREVALTFPVQPNPTVTGA